MSTPNPQRARLSIDVEPELRRRIKIAAAARDLSVREYVEAILRRALASDAPGEDKRAPTTQPEQAALGRLTEEEQQRGLQALAGLERLSAEIAARHRKLTPESWELLNQSREERTRDLMRAVEE